MKINSVLITGGLGFIGQSACMHFLSKGYKVYAFDNISRSGVERNLSKKGLEIIRGDIRQWSDLHPLSELKIEAIIHCAAKLGIPNSIRYPRSDFETNALGTFNILEFARLNGQVPVLFCSSNKVYDISGIAVEEHEMRYDFRKDEPYYRRGITISYPIDGNMHTPHGAAKICGDIYCQEYSKIFNVPTVVNRLSCISGENQFGTEEHGWLSWLCKAARLNKKINIYGNGKQVRDILHGEDLAKLFEVELMHINRLGGKVFNIGGGYENSISILELFDVLRNDYDIEPDAEYKEWRSSDHVVYYSDISGIKKFWEPEIKKEEVIRRMMESGNITTCNVP